MSAHAAQEMSYAAAAGKDAARCHDDTPAPRRRLSPPRGRLSATDAPFFVHRRENLWSGTDAFHQANLNNDCTTNLRFPSSLNISPRDVINALNDLEFTFPRVIAVRRPSPGNFSITFNSPQSVLDFQSHAGFMVNGYAPLIHQHRTRPQFINIRNASPELPDAAIIARLRCFGEVLSFRRCYHHGTEIENGFRTARMRLNSPIPSFVRLASESLHIMYDGQIPTCKKCNRPGHQGRDCDQHSCYNCGEIGHVATACGLPTGCSICKSIAHKARQCPYAVIDRLAPDSPVAETLAVALKHVPVEPPTENESDSEDTEDDASEHHSEGDKDEDEMEQDAPSPELPEVNGEKSSNSTPSTTILSGSDEHSDPPDPANDPSLKPAPGKDLPPPDKASAAPANPPEKQQDLDAVSVASSKRKAASASSSESSVEFNPFARKPTRPARPPTGKTRPKRQK